VTITESRQLSVLALGERRTCRPAPGEVHGLRLADGGALPAVVLHTYDHGLYAGASVLWVLDRRHPDEAIDVACLAGARPMLPPLILHREVWTQGCAFPAGRLEPDHPLLCKRIVFINPVDHRAYDFGDGPVGPCPDDVVARNSLVFLRGLDDRLKRSVRLVSGSR
jgi:hypothetical protein